MRRRDPASLRQSERTALASAQPERSGTGANARTGFLGYCAETVS